MERTHIPFFRYAASLIVIIKRGIFIKNELMVPAGSMDSLVAAIAAGADAVYLGGKAFGARKFARNFTDEELIDAINLAHKCGVRVYVTLNTLLLPEKIPEFIEFLEFLQRAKPDSVIVQDIGAAFLIKSLFPELEMHASVQMTIHNSPTIKWAKEFGFERVVVAREVAYEKLKKMASQFQGLEIFIHGALCYSYSGQCLISGLLTERAANFGMCSQICRKPFSLEGQKGKGGRDSYGQPVDTKGHYLISMKDLNVSGDMEKILSLGLNTLKIEGRMKGPGYVYLVTRIYRRLIEDFNKGKPPKITGRERRELAQAYNRTFTRGYLMGDRYGDIITRERSDNYGVQIGEIVETQGNELVIKVNIGSIGPGDILEFVDWETNLPIDSILVKKFRGAGQNLYKLRVNKSIPLGTRVFKTRDMRLDQSIMKEIKSKNITLEEKKVDFQIKIEKGKPIELVARWHGRELKFNSDQIIEEARTSPTKSAQIKKWLSQSDTSSIKVGNISIEYSEDCFIHAGVVKILRRQATDCIRRGDVHCRRTGVLDPVIKEALLKKGKASKVELKRPGLTATIYDYIIAREINNQNLIQGIYYDIFYGLNNGRFDWEKNKKEIEILFKKSTEKNQDFVLKLPRITHDDFFPAFVPILKDLHEMGARKFQVSNMGQIIFLQEKYTDLILYGDSSFNIMNQFSIHYLSRYLSRISMSNEMVPEQIIGALEGLSGLINGNNGLEGLGIEGFGGNDGRQCEIEVQVSGYAEAIVTENCILGTNIGGATIGKCKMPCRDGTTYSIQDNKGRKYTIYSDNECRNQILNFQEQDLISQIPALYESGVNVFNLNTRGLAMGDILERIEKISKAASIL